MSNLGKKEEEAIREKLQKMILCVGIGNEDSACSVAAINLVLSGRLTDDIPDCMSEGIGSWIIRVQDEMPADMRNSAKWKSLLPYAAGTGRLYEKQRVELILDWVWCEVVPALVPYADRNGFLADWDAVITLCLLGGTWEAFEPCELLEDLINVDPSFYADGEGASPAT